MKIAIIGDSYSAYHQTGQETNHWSYLLSQHFPKHQYINYSTGGRGYDYYRLAMLDAKMKDVDVVLTNETFNHRILSIFGDDLFDFQEEVSDNYKTLGLNDTYWYSIHSDKLRFYGDKKPQGVTSHLENTLLETLRNTSTSNRYQAYNEEWWNNVDVLYDFKHIIKLNLLADPNKRNDENKITYAYIELMNEYGVYQTLQKSVFEGNPLTRKERNQLLLDNDLIVSIDDDHWSPKANKWIFDNYILAKVVDILS